MYSGVTHVNGTFFLRMGTTGLAATKGFTHGRVNFDPGTQTIQFSHHPALPLPAFGDFVREGAVLPFTLLAPDGTERSQRRDIVVHKSKDGLLYAPGISKTPANNSREDGWRIRVFKFRTYFTHPGIETEPQDETGRAILPTWLEQSKKRQRRFWNRLVFLCMEARDACRPVEYDEFLSFLKETVLPAVDTFNNSLGRSKEKIRTTKLRTENPSIFALTRFGAFLQYLEKDGKPVPEGLAEKIFAFAKGTKLDFTPINKFERNLTPILKSERYLEEATVVEEEDEGGAMKSRTVYRRLTDPAEIEARRSELQLRDWEFKPVAAAFASALKRRKTVGCSFFEGWPQFSFEDEEWGIHYYLNGGCDASQLASGGVRGLRLSPAVPAEATGRQWQSGSRRGRRELCPAEISFRDMLSGEQWGFRFALLRHEFPFPDGSHIKEWKLINNRDGLWLCLVVEGRFAKPALSGATGAVHIGWRKEKDEIWPAMIYDPTQTGRAAFHRVTVDVGRCPEKTEQHTPFHIIMGPSRWGRRSKYWISATRPHQRVEPATSGAVQITDTWEGLEHLAAYRDDRKDRFKALLMQSLDPAPSQLTLAGSRTLHQIGEALTNPELQRAYRAWKAEDQEIGNLITTLSARISKRLENGHIQVAHDICKMFVAHGVATVVVQDSLLAKVARKKKGKKTATEAEQKALENSQANRQHVAPGRLLMKLMSLAEEYGLTVVKVDNAFITRNCHADGCNHTNPASASRLITCESCGKVYDQDENAARNMVHALVPPVEDPQGVAA